MPDLGVLNPNPGAQQPLVAPQPAPPSPDSIRLQQALALALMKQGQDTSPIRSPWQGVARVVQSAMGGYEAYQAQQQEANARQQAVADFTKAISGGGQAPAPPPAPASPQPAPSGTPMADNTPSAPAQYQPLIAQASQQYGIPQDILTKQLAAESSFNPQAISPAGAQGIAQFMPGTAKEMGVNALDPNSAIPGAAAYVAQNRDRYGGDMAKALAAYNWGPGNVDKWVAAGANPNALPAETRNYVAKILGPDALNGGNAMAFAPASGSDNPLAALPTAKPNPLAAALAQNTTPAATTSQAGNLAAILGAMSNPYLPSGLQSAGSAFIQKQLTPQIMKVAPGETVYDAIHGKPLFTNGEKPTTDQLNYQYYVKNLPPGQTPMPFDVWATQKARAGATQISNNIDMGGPQAYDKQLADALGKQHAALANGVEESQARARDIAAMQGAIDSIQKNGGTTGGMGQEQVLQLKKTINAGANALGVENPFNEADISDKEFLQKFARTMAGAQAKNAVGARVTNFELQNFLKANPGIDMSITGNQRLLGIQAQIEQRNIAVGNAIRQATAQSIAQGKRIDPVTVQKIITEYDAQHHISDPITGQDLTQSYVLPEFQQGGTNAGMVATHKQNVQKIQGKTSTGVPWSVQ